MRNLTLLLLLLTVIGCSTENPISSDNYEEDQVSEELPSSVDEEKTINLLTVDVGEYNFQQTTVIGKVDWDFRDTDWQYREDGVTYLRKVILEFESDEGRFGENRIILVHLNNDTVRRDANFVEHVDFLGTELILLTEHIGIATFRGDIVGAPTK